MAVLQIKRGTRAQLDAAATAAALKAGELYLITDEDRLAVGLSTTTYSDFALADHTHDEGGGFQPADSDLTALAGLTTTGLIERTGAGTAATVTCTTAGKALLDDTTASAQRTTLGVGTGDSPMFTGVNLGHLSDTTLTRVEAGVAAIEGDTIITSARQQQWISDKYIENSYFMGGVKEYMTGIYDADGFEIDPREKSQASIVLNANRKPKGTYFTDNYMFTLYISDGGLYTLDWTDTTFGTNGVRWVGGVAPTMPGSGSDLLIVHLWRPSGYSVLGAIVGRVS